MIEKNFNLTYEDGYVVGKADGYKMGYDDGYADATNDFESRISKYWAELQTLNARIAYLERHTGLKGDDNA